MNLDVGSGGGKYTSMPRGDICLDMSTPKTGERPRNFILGDAHYLPFRTDSFQSSSAHNLLEHVRNPERVIKELLRVAPIVHFTQDKLWSIGALQEPDHLWIQIPGFIFKPFPRTRLGIGYSRVLSKIILSRPCNIIFREKYKGIFLSKIQPHYFYTIKRNVGG